MNTYESFTQPEDFVERGSTTLPLKSAQQRLVVTVYNSSESGYLTMLLSGLSDLQEQSRIELRFALNRSLAIAPNRASFALWLLVAHEQGETLVYFDLMDHPHIADQTALAKADIYFKRSFSAEVVARQPRKLAAKISPMPLHFGVRGQAHGAAIRFKRARAASDWAATFPDALRRSAVTLLRDLPFAEALGVERLPLCADDFEAEKSLPRARKIYFRTRLYDIGAARNDEIANQLSELNAFRIALIRSLREAFGSLAFAGLYETAGSVRHAPELVQPLPGTDGSYLSHIRHSQQFLVNVNSVGVAGSNGWKLAEILGGGSALVTEHICYEHLDPLRDGIDMLGFKTPAECVAQCERVLAEPELAKSIRLAGLDYFKGRLHPDAAMARILGVVRAKGKGAAI